MGGLTVGDPQDPLGLETRLDRAVGNALGLVADDDQQVGDPAGGLPDPAVAGVALVAQLEHVAEHRDPPAAQAGQDVERGKHRGGRGVVAVVEQGHVAETDELAAMRARGAGGQPGGDGLEIEPGGNPDGGRGQRVVDRVPAERGDRVIDRPPLEVRRSKRIPSLPCDSTSSARTSAPGSKP